MKQTCIESCYTLESRRRILQHLQVCYITVLGSFFFLLLTQLQTFLKGKSHPLFVPPPLSPFFIQCDNLWWSISIFFCLSNSRVSNNFDPLLRLPAPNLVFLPILTNVKQIQLSNKVLYKYIDPGNFVWSGQNITGKASHFKKK